MIHTERTDKMNIWKTTVKDSQSDLYIVATDCSFNRACEFLENENKDNRFGKYLRTEASTVSITKLVFEKRTFFYDESRGYILSH